MVTNNGLLYILSYRMVTNKLYMTYYDAWWFGLPYSLPYLDGLYMIPHSLPYNILSIFMPYPGIQPLRF